MLLRLLVEHGLRSPFITTITFKLQVPLNLSLSHTLTHSLSLSLSHTHTDTHTEVSTPLTFLQIFKYISSWDNTDKMSL